MMLPLREIPHDGTGLAQLVFLCRDAGCLFAADGGFAGVFVLDVVHIDVFGQGEFHCGVFAEVENLLLALAGGKEVFCVGNSGVVAFIQNLEGVGTVDDGRRIVVDELQPLRNRR